MNWLEVMEHRHAVRAYTDQPVEVEKLTALQQLIDAINHTSGMHIQMASGLDDALLGLRTHYGRFSGVHNAIVLLGTGSHVDAQTNTQTNTQTNVQTSVIEQLSAIDTLSSSQIALEEAVGFYGQLLVLEATRLGLATSWCVLDNAHTVEHPWWQQYEGEQAIWFITFGYPARVLTHRRSKSLEQLVSVPEQLSSQALPEWFQQAMQAAMIAPTSLSQQPFVVRLQQDEIVLPEQNSITQWLVSVEATSGLFAYVGVGCVKQHISLALSQYDCTWSVGKTPIYPIWRELQITAESEFVIQYRS